MNFELKTQNSKVKHVGDFKGYDFYSLTNREYLNEHQYDAGKVFVLTDRSDKLMLNGVHIGYANLKNGSVIEWHPERAPKTWERPGKKVTQKKQKVVVDTEVVSEAAVADTKYQQVMKDLDRKYDEMMKRLDERIKI